MVQVPTEVRFANAWIRLAAYVIDSVLTMLIVFLLVMVIHPGGIDSPSAAFHLTSRPLSSAAAYDGLSFIVALGWLAGWQAKAGATPGMFLCRLHVCGPDRMTKPTVVAAVVRNLPLTLGCFTAVAAHAGFGGTIFQTAAGAMQLAVFISIMRSPTRQGFHDRMAGGTVVLHRVPAALP